MNRFPGVEAFNASLIALPEADWEARDAAAARQGQLTKPPGSLGRLEEIAIFLAGWQGREKPVIERGRAVVFAGNHGVVSRGVSAFPAEVTAQMVANFRSGGAAINALAGAAGLALDVVPLSLDRPTADFTRASAMDADECLAALNAGAAAIADADLLVLGEMGIGNTTSAAALALASLFRTRERPLQLWMGTSLAIFFLAGLSWPAEATPAWLALLARLLPTTAGIHLMVGLNQMGASLAEQTREVLNLAILILVYGGLAWWRFTKISAPDLQPLKPD